VALEPVPKGHLKLARYEVPGNGGNKRPSRRDDRKCSALRLKCDPNLQSRWN